MKSKTLKRDRLGRFAKGSVPANKGRRMGAGFRRKCSLGKRRYMKEHPEYIGKIREARLEYFRKNPLARKRISIAAKRIMSNPAARKRLDRKLTEFWRNHPMLRKKKQIETKKYFLTHSLALKKLLEYSKKPLRPHLRTKQGFIVRSAGEKMIADWLFSHDIKAGYESRVLKFPEMICVPDFWLPEFRVYIEFYGGHPASWKRKVEKNKIYRKYKVPCIFITPSELQNLEKYLSGELSLNRKQP